MPEPSAGEILNFRVDPQLGGGDPAILIDNNDFIKEINQNARYSAENKWRKYNVFMDNLKNLYKDLGDISGMDVLTQDRDYLKKENAKIFADIAKDPKLIYSPEIQSKVASLKSEATESKLNRIYDFAHREFINRNPELNTEQNKSKLEAYGKQKLGAREAYTLDMPVIFDVGAYGKELINNPIIARKFAEVTQDEKFIREGTRYNRDAFLKAWNTGINTEKDKYGHSIRGAVQDLYNNSPLKSQYDKAGGIEKFWEDLGVQAFGSDKDIESTANLQHNPNYIDPRELAIKKGELAVKWANHNLAQERLDKEDAGDLVSADTVLNEASSIINAGEEKTVYINNKPTKVLRIGDPTLLQTFGNVDKDGNVTNVPTAIEYGKDNNQLLLIYETPKGKRERNIALDQRTWLKHIAKRSFPNKDIGNVNTIVEKILQANENNLYKISQKASGKQTETETTIDINSVPTGTKLEERNGKYYYNGKEVKM